MNVHLAQINIGRLRAPLDDPKIAGFVAPHDPINALADAAPGFVWRLQSASGNATELAYKTNPLVIVNMSSGPPPCATTSTHPDTSTPFATAPGGLKKWTSLTTVFGGFPRVTSQPCQKAAKPGALSAARSYSFWFSKLFPAPVQELASA
jgi:hypothetical protein